MQVLYMEKVSITLSFIFPKYHGNFSLFQTPNVLYYVFFYSKYQIFLPSKKPIKIYLIIFLLWEGGGAVN